MSYETRLQIGEFLITIDIEGGPRPGYTAAVFFERADDGALNRRPAMKHLVPNRHTTANKAHQAAFEHAVYVIKLGEVGLQKP